MSNSSRISFILFIFWQLCAISVAASGVYSIGECNNMGTVLGYLTHHNIENPHHNRENTRHNKEKPHHNTEKPYNREKRYNRENAHHNRENDHHNREKPHHNNSSQETK